MGLVQNERMDTLFQMNMIFKMVTAEHKARCGPFRACPECLPGSLTNEATLLLSVLCSFC